MTFQFDFHEGAYVEKYVPTDGRMDGLPNFLTYGAPLFTFRINFVFM